MDKIDLTKSKIMGVLRKMPNWKASGPENLQGHWLENLIPLHNKLLVYFQDCLDSRVVSDWLKRDEQCLYKSIRQR